MQGAWWRQRASAVTGQAAGRGTIEAYYYGLPIMSSSDIVSIILVQYSTNNMEPIILTTRIRITMDVSLLYTGRCLPYFTSTRYTGRCHNTCGVAIRTALFEARHTYRNWCYYGCPPLTVYGRCCNTGVASILKCLQ